MLFPELFENTPQLVRGFLQSALQLSDLQSLYEEARDKYPDLQLSSKLLKLLSADMEISDQDLQRIPHSGPLLVVANHPFGILDGMLLDQVLLRVRPDIKILTNALICGLEELKTRCLPIEVFGGEGALENNFRCLRQMMGLLRKGQGVAFFPAGEVSHWRREFRCITDPPWSTIAVRCSLAADVPVIPIFFTGQNSLGFQLAGMIHPRLRTARLPGELLNKRGRTVEVRVGSLIKPGELRKFESAEKATDYLRARTYMLGHRKTDGQRTWWPGRPQPRPNVAGPRPGTLFKTASAATDPQTRPTPGIGSEIARLHADGKMVVESDDYSVYRSSGGEAPALLEELGRLREITFRAVGEGTGRGRDLDRFDSYYQHLILWHKGSKQVAGSYRLAWTDQVLPEHGMGGLYTSTLFRFQPGFFARLGPALELGRSFVRTEFQKEYGPLLLLWQAIARVASQRPEAPVLFGAVSISGGYSEASRELIVQFVSKHSFRSDLAQLAVPRNPFRSRLTNGFEFSTVSQCMSDLESLASPMCDIGDVSGVPILLRQYCKLGGRVAGFNVDRKFSNALDGLLIVDLRETNPKMLDRYMGPASAAAFRSGLQRG